MNTDSYLTLEEPCEGLFKSKGSKHFGYVYPVKSTDEIQVHLNQLRKKHHAARHHCFAYRLGPSGETWRVNDDGEPSNSAGPPIHGALKSRELNQVLGVVVRYFGGTKLGVGGLIEAYREATFAAISNGSIVQCFVLDTLHVEFPYEQMGPVMQIVKRWKIEPEQVQLDNVCKITLHIRAALSRDLSRLLQAIPHVSIG